MPDFPDDFAWGVSTAAYQIEGAATDGGKGESIWDRFAHTPGRVIDGSTGDVATDHVRRYREDVALLAELGVTAYRFSVSWPRVQPHGRGRGAPAGWAFYDRLVDALLERGIEPWVCLYHWDLPQALQDVGGWTRRDIAATFADYAERVADRLGDRVTTFLMLNEPNVHAVLGHLVGEHAPGLAGLAPFFAALHHQNLATGEALQRLRAMRAAWRLGTIVNLQPIVAAEDGEEHEAAAALADAAFHRASLDPLLLGSYPEVLTPFLAPLLQDGDVATVHQPIDLLGVNHYTRQYVRADDASPTGLALAEPPPNAERTAMGWEVAPEAFTAQLIELKERYGNPPVVVTENGTAYPDPAPRDGRVDDPDRIRYLHRYLRALADARAAGCDVRGYFVWTLVDNFEWAHGFRHRFGLVHLDRATQARTPKRSFDAYRDVVRSRSVPERD